jgi:hypothetical protein
VTIEQLGSIGELVGGVATIATLLYLALQIRANTLATKRQSLDDVIDRVIRWQSRLVESPDLIHSWRSGQASFNALPPDDQLRFAALSLEIFSVLESGIEAGKFGDIKPETAEAARALVANLTRSKGVQEWWETNGRNIMAADFVRDVDRISDDARATDQSIPGPLPFVPSADER